MKCGNCSGTGRTYWGTCNKCHGKGRCGGKRKSKSRRVLRGKARRHPLSVAKRKRRWAL
jgi:DnaJ-class molecular chaperone